MLATLLCEKTLTLFWLKSVWVLQWNSNLTQLLALTTSGIWCWPDPLPPQLSKRVLIGTKSWNLHSVQNATRRALRFLVIVTKLQEQLTSGLLKKVVTGTHTSGFQLQSTLQVAGFVTAQEWMNEEMSTGVRYAKVQLAKRTAQKNWLKELEREQLPSWKQETWKFVTSVLLPEPTPWLVIWGKEQKFKP